MSAVADITLQINLSPGDVTYARLTVPRLVEAHRDGVRETLAVVDCCRPQRTQTVDPDARFPQPAFRRRVDEVRALAEDLKRGGLLDRVYYMEEGCDYFLLLSRRYTRSLVKESHACRATGFMAYLLMFELPRTRYVLHYDADMLLFQAPGFDWPAEALRLMAAEEEAVAGSCQVHPPPADAAPAGPFLRVRWFSTHCFLMDRGRLSRHLPLLNGTYYLEVWLRKLLQRSYPPDPEMMLFRTLDPRGCWRLDLTSPCAWLLHPSRKDEGFVALLPAILRRVAAGEFPEAQRGKEDLLLEEWEAFLSAPAPLP
jgi:hypothetical protein